MLVVTDCPDCFRTWTDEISMSSGGVSPQSWRDVQLLWHRESGDCPALPSTPHPASPPPPQIPPTRAATAVRFRVQTLSALHDTATEWDVSVNWIVNRAVEDWLRHKGTTPERYPAERNAT